MKMKILLGTKCMPEQASSVISLSKIVVVNETFFCFGILPVLLFLSLDLTI
jgi:hypothetical protein